MSDSTDSAETTYDAVEKGGEKLKQIAARLNNGEPPIKTTPRELLGFFGRSRRTWNQVKTVVSALNAAGLETKPYFDGVSLDADIRIRRKADEHMPEGDPFSMLDSLVVDLEDDAIIDLSHDSEPQADAGLVSPRYVDPIHRIQRLLPTTKVHSVTRDASLEAAVTTMLLHDFSQLPVMQGDREVSGMISWRSIGQAKAFSREPRFVRDCIEPCAEIKYDDSIFDAIRQVQQHECVLVRGRDKKIIGLLTSADFSAIFEELSKPFLYLSYIENTLRSLIQRRFSNADLSAARDPADFARVISDVSDLTFGEYVRLLENPANWSKFGDGLDRSIFIAQLDGVREIRNNVMHFNPEGIEPADLEALKRFNRFLQSFI